ncbi:EAL domain-containing protein [Sphingomonas sp. HH69]
MVNAIRLGQLSIRLQPKVRACDGITLSAEVLVRWESPVLGALSPATFIPIVERAGLLPHITDLVLRQTAQCQLELLRRGLPARLAVNISALEFGLDLPGRLVAICAEFGADPALIEVEITETALMQDLHRAGQVIDSLRQKGVKVALDDFGTGYSSFSYLQQLHIDTLKIDRSFVENVARESSGQQIVRSMIGLAQGLGLNIVAEGVETEEQRKWLMNNGCAMMQGYLFARPFKPADYYMFLSNVFTRASVAGLLPDPQTGAAKLPQ